MGVEGTGAANHAKPHAHADDTARPKLVKDFNAALDHAANAEGAPGAQGSSNAQSTNKTNSQQHAAGSPKPKPQGNLGEPNPVVTVLPRKSEPLGGAVYSADPKAPVVTTQSMKRLPAGAMRTTATASGAGNVSMAKKSTPVVTTLSRSSDPLRGANVVPRSPQHAAGAKARGNFGDVNMHKDQGLRGKGTPGALESEHLEPIAVQRENMRNPTTGRSPIPAGRGSAIDNAQPTVMLHKPTADAKTASDRPVIAGAKNAAKTGQVPPAIANEYGPEAGLARARAAARAMGTTVPIGAEAAAIGQTNAKYADPAIRSFAREPVNNPLLGATNEEISRAVDIPLKTNTQTAGNLTSLAATKDPAAKTLFKGTYSEVASAGPHSSPKPGGGVKSNATSNSTAAASKAPVGQGTNPGSSVEAAPKVAKSPAGLTQPAKTQQAARTVGQNGSSGKPVGENVGLMLDVQQVVGSLAKGDTKGAKIATAGAVGGFVGGKVGSRYGALGQFAGQVVGTFVGQWMAGGANPKDAAVEVAKSHVDNVVQTFSSPEGFAKSLYNANFALKGTVDTIRLASELPERLTSDKYTLKPWEAEWWPF